MQAELEAEKRALTRIWAKREKQVTQAVANMVLLFGGIQGIAGETALPGLPVLELPSAALEPA